MTIFFYKWWTRNPEIPIWVLPNIWRMGRVRVNKLGRDVSSKMLLNAANYRVTSFAVSNYLGKTNRVYNYPTTTTTPRLGLILYFLVEILLKYFNFSIFMSHCSYELLLLNVIVFAVLSKIICFFPPVKPDKLRNIVKCQIILELNLCRVSLRSWYQLTYCSNEKLN